MATAATGVEPKETECSVCHGDFTVPKILPCGHLLCRDCLVTWLKADGNNQCPLCRCAIADPRELSRQSCEELADGLPTDLAMASLVGSVHLLSKDHVCCVCNNVAAVGLCLQCGDMYCSACVAAHKKISATRHHKVESLSSLTPERLSASRPGSCSAHSDRPPELYCPKHGVSICVVCATSDHRACPEVSKLEARVKEAHAVLDELLAMLSDGEKKLQRAISQLDKDLQSIDSNTKAALAEIDATYDQLEKSLKAWRRRLQQLVKEADSKAKAAVNGGRSVLIERRGKLTSHRHLTQRAKQTTPPDSVGTMTSTLQARVASLDTSDTWPENAQRWRMKRLILNPVVMADIKRQLDSLGELMDMPEQSVKTQATDWRFHTNHGTDIVLSQDRQTAERRTRGYNTVVVSEDSMLPDALYEVQLTTTILCVFSKNTVYTGVTSKDPASLCLPDYLSKVDVAHVIVSDGVISHGKKVESSISRSLDDVPEGTCVGVLVDKAGCLHVYVNGQDKGVACSGVNMPCYALFDLWGAYEKIKTLPVKYMK